MPDRFLSPKKEGSLKSYPIHLDAPPSFMCIIHNVQFEILSWGMNDIVLMDIVLMDIVLMHWCGITL